MLEKSSFTMWVSYKFHLPSSVLIQRSVKFQRNPEGVAQIFFKEAEDADKCIELLNNRWFGQRKITAETWDGKTKYKWYLK